jgi:Zn-dependent protease with chaperone function
MSANAAVLDSPDHWIQFSAAERESFFAAIARHRRMSWRVTIAVGFAISISGLIVATLTAPLFYAAFALILDLINIVVPTPNIVESIMARLDPLMESATTSATGWIEFGALAAIPGLLWVGVLLFALRRALRQAATIDPAELGARLPTPQVLAEQRFVNVVIEMALAAQLAEPRVLVVERGTVNAAVIGTDEQHVTIVISTGLLSRLNRDELQGVAAHLIGMVANGDIAIGLRSSLVISFFGVVGRFATILSDSNDAKDGFLAMLRPLLVPTRATARKLITMLADPFAPTERKERRKDFDWKTATWRERASHLTMLTLMGPVVMTGFFGGIVSAFGLGSLLSFAWRQRKYLADATAVRLTRDPDTLARALEKMGAAGGGGTLDQWADHLSVSHGARGKSSFGAMVPMFPSLERRLKALAKLGAAEVRLEAKPPMPLKIKLIVIVLGSIAGGLMLAVLPLLMWLSMALSMVFLGLPFSLLHMLVRAIGH